MGLFKQLKDRATTAGATAVAATRAIGTDTAAQLDAARAYHATAGQPLAAASLAPINGVDMATYAWVSKQVAKAGYDQSLAVGFAGQRGVAPADWEAAVNGWAERMQAEPALGREFRRHFDAA